MGITSSSTRRGVQMRRVLLTILVLGLSVSSAFAQATGQINGVVADNSGGVVPGVTVFAVESGTGISRDTVTGANGRYSFLSIAAQPRTKFEPSSRGSEPFARRTSFCRRIRTSRSTSRSSSVSCPKPSPSPARPRRSTSRSRRSSEVVDSKRIVELPLNGRDAARLSMLVSGMVVTEVNQESGKTIPGALRLSTNGTESRQASFRLDGTNHTDSYFQQNQPFPFPDALQEFSIQTSNYSAAQGASAGAVVNAVTRSGTNNFHGGAFGYLRDRTFNSKNFFLPERDFLKRKQYGGYAGGPIVRNKLFFFAGWQGTKIENVGGTLNHTVPTAAMRDGDFSADLRHRIRDPNGGVFPNNQIPVGRFDPASVNVMKYMPVGRRQRRRRARAGSAPHRRRTTIRSSRRSTRSSTRTTRSARGTSSITSRTIRRYNDGNLLSYRGPTLGSRQRIQNVVGSWQRTMTSTLLNEFRVGFNKFASSRYPPAGVPSMQDLGVRLPIYPTAAVDLRDPGQRILRHRRQPLRVSSRARLRDQRPRELGEGQASDSVRRRDGDSRT